MCGVIGIYNNKDASKLIYLSLHAIQHRAQESAGIAISNGDKIISKIDMGIVSDVFSDEDLERLKGTTGIGQIRYSTQGAKDIKDGQPLVFNIEKKDIAIGHNGDLLNASALKEEYAKTGSLFYTSSDTEIMLHNFARSDKKELIEKIIYSLKLSKGAYSIVMLREGKLIAARDPFGFRPLVLGKKDDSYAVASETCALDIIKYDYVRDIEPGEIILIDESGLKSFKPFPSQKPKMCTFELVYFSRPDSVVFGISASKVKKELGRQLAKKYKIDADLVISVPDSGNSAAIGYSYESKIPFDFGFIRSHYIGRTFISPGPNLRETKVLKKLNPDKEVINGKRVIVVDDSIVRGTTMKEIIKLLRRAGAAEVHILISYFPWKYRCKYGIDTPTNEELIASARSLEEIKSYLDVDTIGYLTEEEVFKAIPLPKENFCTACGNGNYPV